MNKSNGRMAENADALDLINIPYATHRGKKLR